MKITDIMIEQFGSWNDLLLPVRKKGLSLIHGPNEAGKSTLMRFIRGVLYGYPVAGLITSEGGQGTTGWGGSLRTKHRGEHYELTRRIEENGSQVFRVNHKNKTISHEKYEEKILQNINADVYRTIYTLGLKELRELATLQSEHVSDYIYGTSLGAVGQQLLNSGHQVSQYSKDLADEQQGQGKLFDLSDQYNSLQQALGRADNVLTQYELGVTKQKTLQKTQADQKHRLEQLQHEQKNYQFLARVWKPWKRHRELMVVKKQLDALAGFPQQGLNQLEKLEQNIASACQKQKALQKQISEIKTQLSEDRKQYRLREHASGVRALIDLRGVVEIAERHLSSLTADATLIKSELDQKMDSADFAWSLDHLETVDTSPQAHLELVTLARKYQTALRRRARYRNRYQKLADANHNRQIELQEQFKQLNITSIDQAIEKANQRLREIETLAIIRVQEVEYDQRIRSAKSQLIRLQQGSKLPWEASLMLTMFAFGGGFFVVAGLINGMTTGWLVGLIYLLTGIMGVGLARSMQLHYEDNDFELQHKLQQEIKDSQLELESIQDQISQITGISYNVQLLPIELENEREENSEPELIREATLNLINLEQMSRTEQRIKKLRISLSTRRGKLADYQREASLARQSWCDLLKKIGLQETVRTTEAFEQWQHAGDIKQTLLEWNAAQSDVQRHSQLLSLFREQMEQISERMQIEIQPDNSLTQTLNDWEDLLEQYERIKQTYQLHRTKYRELKLERTANRNMFPQTKTDLQDLLEKGHAKTRGQFREHAQQFEKAGEIHALINDLNDQMATLAQEEPTLAIVEEDLIAFDPVETQQRIDVSELEIEDIGQELEQSHQELGRISQSRAALESDTTLADLKTRQARLLDRARITLRDWQASQKAKAVFSDMTGKLEREYQPEALARASKYLCKLTCNRYEQVRTPFGSQELIVHEQDGTVRQVWELSDGTREQLFLAVRLALIDMFAEQGIELPIVLDDICVNFDQTRTEAAVKTLIEFAQTKQVLFFTCHNHLAKLFEKQGIEATWLPNHYNQENHLLAG